ncbi:hypothetical protein HYC85_030520 [Camellia sinensis]|uniref:ATP-dependent DNA helicase n=1 Tax=Camellia sinensis TaxID=4442 RepID=A0A7J7G147_CAMSI|nr:hypothetical protein HYC85_030520 [Camellia sinensis]
MSQVSNLEPREEGSSYRGANLVKLTRWMGTYTEPFVYHSKVRFLQERNVNVVIRDERDLNTIRIHEAKAKEKDKAIPYGKGKENAHPMVWPPPTTPCRNVGVVIRDEHDLNVIRVRAAKDKEKVNPMSKGKEKMAPSGKRMTNACQVIRLPLLITPPSPLQALYDGNNDQSKSFRSYTRVYNATNAFTSLGATLDPRVLSGRGPTSFTIHGELRHRTGSLQPQPGQDASYAQLYIYDSYSALEIRNRRNPNLRRDVLKTIQDSLLQVNAFVDKYRQAHAILHQLDSVGHNLPAHFHYNSTTDRRRYNLPTTDEIAIVIPDAWAATEQNRLTYYKLNQGKLRAELYQELSDMDPDYVRPGQIGQRGLSEDDEEWIQCLKEAAVIKTGYQLRRLFSKSLIDFPPMPQPTANWSAVVGNRLIVEHQQLQSEAQHADPQITIDCLNNGQRNAYNAITSSVFQNKGTVFFLNGGAGTGKTFLYNTIALKCRSLGHIVVTVALSGIASLLLIGTNPQEIVNLPSTIRKCQDLNELLSTGREGKMRETWAYYMMMIGIGTVVVVVLLMIMFVAKWVINKQRNKGITKGAHKLPPGRRGWPLIGDSFNWFNAVASSHPPRFVQQQVLRYGKIFSCSLFGKWAVVSADPSFNRWVMQNEGKLFQSSYPKSFRDLVGKNGVITVQGEQQRKLHGIASNMMRLEKLKFHFLKDIQMVAINLMVNQLLGVSKTEGEVDEMARLFSDFVDGCLSLPINLPGNALECVIFTHLLRCILVHLFHLFQRSRDADLCFFLH